VAEREYTTSLPKISPSLRGGAPTVWGTSRSEAAADTRGAAMPQRGDDAAALQPRLLLSGGRLRLRLP